MKGLAFWLGTAMLPFLLLGGDAVKRSAAVKALPTDILVRVNGVDITRGQLERHIDMMVALLKNKRKSTPPQLIAKFKAKNRKPLSDKMFQRLVMQTCLASSNITITTEAKSEVERECLQGFGKPKQTLDDLKLYVAKAGFSKEFTDNVNFDIRLKSFLMTTYSNKYHVTQLELEKIKNNLLAYNKRADATNAMTRTYAASILQRARSGEDFGVLADAYTQDPDSEKQPKGVLGDCDESDFPEEKHIWNILNDLPEGAISDVLHTEDGYAIFKVVRRNTAEQSQTGDASLTLARIFFRRAYKFPEQTDEELRLDVEKEKREELMTEVYKAFRAQSDVSYPNGPVRAK